jgi:rare lipoprotein A
VDGRIIDVSRAAARDIDLLIPGITKVRLEIIAAPSPKGGQYGVQVGAFRERENADRLRREMERRLGATRLVSWRGMWRVVVGSESTVEAANALAERLRGDKRTKTAFVVRLDL